MSRLAVLLAFLIAADVAAQSAVTYTATFDATWSATTHPEGFPPSPHFSRLVGATHDATSVLWAPGSLASDGMEAMAERGSTALLKAEIDALRAAGASIAPILGGSIGLSPGATAIDVEVTPDRPLVTLVSMLAPSPDWFVGVRDLDLRDGNEWVGQRTVELFVYDAGTDSGPAYTSADADTQPREPIARIDAPPFAGSNGPQSVGTLTFTRVATGPEPDAPSWSVGSAAPNPAAGDARLDVRSDRARIVRVAVLDRLGRRVAGSVHEVRTGLTWLPVPSRDLAVGVYVVQVTSDRGTESRRLTVVR